MRYNKKMRKEINKKLSNFGVLEDRDIIIDLLEYIDEFEKEFKKMVKRIQNSPTFSLATLEWKGISEAYDIVLNCKSKLKL